MNLCSNDHDEICKCAVCRHEVDKNKGKFIDKYSEWVCGDNCQIEFLTQLLEEREKTSRLANLAKSAAITGNHSDLHAYLEERRKHL